MRSSTPTPFSLDRVDDDLDFGYPAGEIDRLCMRRDLWGGGDSASIVWEA
jgi:hypothetical protein